MLKQLICWFKTRHRNRKQLKSHILSVYENSNHKIKDVELIFKCNDCGFISNRIKHND